MGLTEFIKAKCDLCGRDEIFTEKDGLTPDQARRDAQWSYIQTSLGPSVVICPNCKKVIRFYIQNLRDINQDYIFDDVVENEGS